MNKIVFILALCSLINPQICLGAEFRNLGFDEADLTGLRGPGPADPKAVLPGWILLRDGERTSVVYVNVMYDFVSDRVELGDYHQFGGIAEGKYALYFFRVLESSPVWTLEQTGTIPPGTRFLTYRSGTFPMEVRINDEIIPRLNWELPPFDWQLPGRGPNVVYDVSAFAGQDVKLSFVGPFGPKFGSFGGPELRNGGAAYIDSILFLAEVPRITAVVQTAPGTKTNEVTLRFTPIAGRDMFVEYRDDLSRDGVWQLLQTPPGNSGTITDRSPATHRFYRLRVSVPREGLP